MNGETRSRADTSAPTPPSSGPGGLPPPAGGLQALVTVVPELKLMVGMVTGGAIIAALYFGRDILIPLALALLLGFVLDPLVARLKRWGMPRAPAVFIVVALALATIAAAGLMLGSQVSALSAELPIYQSNIQGKLRALQQSVNRPGMFDGAVRVFDAVRSEVEQEDSPAAAPSPAKSGPAAQPVQRVQITERPNSSLRQAMGWLQAALGPLANAGIVLVFVVLILLDRLDLRDRLLRLWGGSLHRSTDAMDEAGTRISKYLTMQLVVNLSYGIPMAAGLWLIGVPGAMLWGAVAAVMRFVPYVGPMISAVFPIGLAFAVDPGWSMVLWTIGLIAVLEMLSNNVVEPWLYGVSTGLSAMSLMVSATFWTALWGPVGLIMSTPLTVCLLVIGRHLPRLRFLDVLLGSQPALDTPTRIYQRLIAGDVEEASELAIDQVEDGKVAAFYDDTGLPVLRMAASDHASVATVEHRHRVVVGMDALIDDMQEQYPAPAGVREDAALRPDVVCIGGKWEVDTLAARMLAHALSLEGQAVAYRSAGTVTADYVAGLDLEGVRCVLLSYFSPEPQVQAKHFCRRLRRRWPEVKIVLGLWNDPGDASGEEGGKALGADALVTSAGEAVARVMAFTNTRPGNGFVEAPVPETEAERLAALRASGALDPRAQPIFDAASQRAADIFDMPMAMVSLIDETMQLIGGAFGRLRPPAGSDEPVVHGADLTLPRNVSMCGHVVANAQTLVVPDIARDMRFADNPTLRSKRLRFYAGAPLTTADGHAIGTLCLLDTEPHALSAREVRLFEAMAADLMKTLAEHVAQWSAEPPIEPPAATVGQLVPMS